MLGTLPIRWFSASRLRRPAPPQRIGNAPYRFARGCLAALGIVTAGLAQADTDWGDWPYQRPVTLEAAVATRLVSVPIVPEMYAHLQPGLADLRVIDADGREVPYLVHVPRGVQRQEWRDARLLEVSVLPGEYTQAVVDTGLPSGSHNAIELTVRETDFFAWVEVAVSGDQSVWRLLDERLPFYRFTAEGHGGRQVLRYSPSTSRFLRLRLRTGSDPLTVTGARVGEEIVEEPERETLATAAPAPAADLPDRHSGWRADFEGGGPPVSEAVFTTGEPEFHRPVRVRASDDGRRWRIVGSGDIYRLHRAAGTSERLRVTFPDTTARHLQVEVFNRNDPPLPGLTVALRGVPRRVVFRQEPGRQYRLIYGYTRATAPSYELAQLVTSDEIRVATDGALGAEASMPGHPRPAPWTERHAVVLWLALGLAVAVLAWLAVRSMRSPA